MISTVLEGGWIVDGTGQPRFATDVAIERDRIVRIGDCAELQAMTRIDARGAIVAPGFVDAGAPGPHKREQGITTELGMYDELEPGTRPRIVTIDDIETFADEAYLHVTNLRVEWPRGRDAMHRLLERIDRANDRGARITCDVAPYVATWLDLLSLLPDGVTRASLADRTVAETVALEMQIRLDARWRDIVYEGSRLDAKAAVVIMRSPEKATHALAFCLNEDDIATAFSAAFCMPGSHPRVVGAFARVFGRYVRQRRVFSLEEAVARSTALPARTFGRPERGTIAAGARADLVVFDEATFRDTATYDWPDALPVGLRHVFVNGELL